MSRIIRMIDDMKRTIEAKIQDQRIEAKEEIANKKPASEIAQKKYQEFVLTLAGRIYIEMVAPDNIPSHAVCWDNAKRAAEFLAQVLEEEGASTTVVGRLVGDYVYDD